MPGSKKIKKIYDELEALDQVERLEVLHRLIDWLRHDIEKRKMSKTRQITEFAGLGKELWDGVDVEAYINGERDAWK